MPQGPARLSWKAFLVVSLNSVATIASEVSEYLTDVSTLLIKDIDDRNQDTVRLEIESLKDQ